MEIGLQKEKSKVEKQKEKRELWKRLYLTLNRPRYFTLFVIRVQKQ